MTEDILSQARQNLNAAIENLYAAFARYQLHGPVEGCPHCTSKADDERLQAHPMRELSADDLARFAFKAVTTLGTVDDFKHFLPRLLEIVAHEGQVGYVDIQIVLGKLQYTHWTFWPQNEREAIEKYLWALWQSVLTTFPCEPDAENLLGGIGRAMDDLMPFLDSWRRDNELPAAQHLVEFVEANLTALLRKHRLVDVYWKEREPQMRQVISWLVEPALAQHMEQMFFQHSNDPIAEELSKLVEELALVQRAFAPSD